MADFEKAYLVVAENEGGIVNDKNDPGGLTNGGISLRHLRNLMAVDPDGKFNGDFNGDGDVDEDDILNLTPEQKKSFFKETWWNKFRYGEIENQRLATKVFDLSVNLGPKRPHKMLQRACCMIVESSKPIEVDGVIGSKTIEVDGIIGSKTIKAVNELDHTRLLLSVKNQAAETYRNLARLYDRHRKHINGWLKRLDK